MSDNEYEKIAPGLLKIGQVLGSQYQNKETISDKKKLLTDALNQIGEIIGVSFDIPSGILGDNIDDFMDKISIHSGIRIQKISLNANWWQGDLGIILAFIDERPCVLIPEKNGAYRLSTDAGPQGLLTEDKAQRISNYGFTFTPPLPKKINTLMGLLKFSFSPFLSKMKTVIYVQLGLSLLLMSLPLLISYFFNHFNEFIESGQTALLSISLVINSVIFFLLSIYQSMVLLHLRFKVQIRLEPAIWDKLLKLTPIFYRQFNSGDIAYRASVVSTIQDMLTQSSLLSLFSVITLIVSFALMCFYDMKLAMLALLSIFIILPIVFFVTHQVLTQQRKVYDSLTKQSGFVFQVISGIMKFKVSASEFRAFNIWSDYFTSLLIARYKADKIQIVMHMLHSLLLMTMTLVLFCIYVYVDMNLKFGSFIAFNAAFSQFFTALITFMSTITSTIPLFEQSQVNYEAKEELLKRSGSHIPLEGKISIKNLSFRYDEGQPLIYKSINLEVNPGEVIGITGTSGCGKSTLFRLLTGMETPLDGQIFYDDVNLDMLNLSSLRKQIGIVTQKSILTPGTILENIIGNDSNLTRTEAWDIVIKLGMEQMIAALPMEMDTFINEGMQSLSGGEQQRIVLARALIKTPKIIFLDEATSALDVQNQANIQDYLAQLNITQLIIAHRLSTLKNVDRILVIHDGRIVQEGNFEQLVREEGYFSELAKFQFG